VFYIFLLNTVWRIFKHPSIYTYFSCHVLMNRIKGNE
jgi:hypothetical protein